MKYSSKLKACFEDDPEWPETIKEFKMKKKKKKLKHLVDSNIEQDRGLNSKR